MLNFLRHLCDTLCVCGDFFFHVHLIKPKPLAERALNLKCHNFVEALADCRLAFIIYEH